MTLFGVQIDPKLVELLPGESVPVTVTITNLTSNIVKFAVELVSHHPGITAAPQQVSVPPGGQSGAVAMNVAVTDGPAAPPAGTTVVGVRVRFLSLAEAQRATLADQVSRVEELQLTVGAAGVASLSAEQGVVRGGTSARLQVTATNHRNQPLTLGFSGHDPEGAVRFSFTPQVVVVPPYGQHSVAVTAKARQPFSGPETSRQLTIMAEGGLEPLSCQATFIQDSRINPVVLRVLGAVLAIAVLAGSVIVAAILARGDGTPTIAGGTGGDAAESGGDGDGQEAQTVPVPDVVGLAEPAAAGVIGSAQLMVGPSVRSADEAFPAGVVIGSSPPAGTALSPGTEVSLEVSTGPTPPPQVSVPDVVGHDEATAVAALAAACGTSPCLEASLARDFSDDVPEGVVVRQDPGPGTQISVGEAVDVIVSLGPEEPESVGTPVTPFVGVWTNQDPNTGGNTRFEIGEVSDMLALRAFGKCHPTDCDWGIETGEVSGSTALVVWDQGFVVRNMTLELLDDGRLRVFTEHAYRDNRADRADEAFFVLQG